MMKQRDAKFQIGQVVRHRVFPFRGVIFDVDPEYANTEEWWNSIPAEVRPTGTSRFTICLPRTKRLNMSLMSPSKT